MKLMIYHKNSTIQPTNLPGLHFRSLSLLISRSLKNDNMLDKTDNVWARVLLDTEDPFKMNSYVFAYMFTDTNRKKGSHASELC